MKTIFTIVIAIALCNIAIAQTDTLGTSDYRCRTFMMHTGEKFKGDIYKTGYDSLIIKFQKNAMSSMNLSDFELMPIPVSKISYLSINRKGSQGRGFLIGGLFGGILGGLIGYSGGDDQPTPGTFDIFVMSAADKAAVGGVTGFLIGGLIGLAAGSAKIIVDIDGDHEKYKSKRAALDGYTIIKNK